MKMDFDIFVSYCRRDFDTVKAIKEELEDVGGARCWMDLEGIESGDQFVNVIISAINRSETFMFMLSQASMNSEWALDELDFAKKKGKRIVIVSIEEVEMTDKFYFTYHKYDQTDWLNDIQKGKLMRDVRKWTGKEEEERKRKEEEERKRKEEEERKRKEEEERKRKEEEERKRKEEEERKTENTEGTDYRKTLPDYNASEGSHSVFGNFKILMAVLFATLSSLLIFSYLVIKPITDRQLKRQEVKIDETSADSLSADSLLRPFANKKKLFGYIDRNNKQAIQCKWRQASEFHEGRARVMDDKGLFGFINLSGAVAVKCKWHDAYDFKNGLARVKNNSDKWGYIDRNGRLVLPCKWQRVFDFKDGRAYVQDEYGKWMYINHKGQETR